jgi:hypothetical protein
MNFQNRTNNGDVKVLIAGIECSIISTSTNQIQCETGSYAFSTIRAPVQVNIVNTGLARNVKSILILLIIQLK